MNSRFATWAWIACFLVGAVTQSSTQAQVLNSKYGQRDEFRQLEEILPTPNTYRTASGAPGTSYWQQRANYIIDVRLDDDKQEIHGSEKITYQNHSPDELSYLWLQLDVNQLSPTSDGAMSTEAPPLNRISTETLESILLRQSFDGSLKITEVKDSQNKDMKYTIVKTMMRIDLDKPLPPGETISFSVAWNYRIVDATLIRTRSGYEFFEKDGNYIYEMAHWYPRMVAYTDYTGWQHKQFLGNGEFTLELGDYMVRITAPEDHIVGATGVLLNDTEVLSDEQRQRLESAKSAKTPVFIVTPEEAKENQKEATDKTKTWIFKADNVRDFAWASSRKFIWDAQQHDVEGNQVMAMSYYPNEAEPLWSKYSTHSIIHTLNVYSRYTFAYPYPTAISVNGPIYGMEYPMICFNGPRPEEDGTYSAQTKYGLISVIIHEVGHNYFPMIVNSDERQWTWMDEGLNTFLQYLSEQEWEDDYPSRRGEPKDIVSYMRSGNQVPIMTNSESILQFGNNAYGKPATALNILRETILGRELFDFAFKEYARRWKFKRPTPADFFRTMEDASGVDLDWFWRGWFYSTMHVDISIEGMRLYTLKSPDPDIENAKKKQEREDEPTTLSEERNKPLRKRTDDFPELKDFYNSFDELDVTDADRKSFEKFMDKLNDKEKRLFKENRNFYVMDFKNVGGLVMPIIIQIEYEDGEKETLQIPAEIWSRDSRSVSKLIITSKTIKSVEVDPRLQTADVERENNYLPRRVIKSRFELFKDEKKKNEMQKAKAAEDGQDNDDDDDDEEDEDEEDE